MLLLLVVSEKVAKRFFESSLSVLEDPPTAQQLVLVALVPPAKVDTPPEDVLDPATVAAPAHTRPVNSDSIIEPFQDETTVLDTRGDDRAMIDLPLETVPAPAVKLGLAFEEDEAVVVQGLQRCPALNGRSAVVTGYDAAQERYKVIVVEASGKGVGMLLKAKNLRKKEDERERSPQSTAMKRTRAAEEEDDDDEDEGLPDQSDEDGLIRSKNAASAYAAFVSRSDDEGIVMRNDQEKAALAADKAKEKEPSFADASFEARPAAGNGADEEQPRGEAACTRKLETLLAKLQWCTNCGDARNRLVALAAFVTETETPVTMAQLQTVRGMLQADEALWSAEVGGRLVQLAQESQRVMEKLLSQSQSSIASLKDSLKEEHKREGWLKELARGYEEEYRKQQELQRTQQKAPVSLTVPAGLREGDKFGVETEFGVFDVVVPEGCRSGDNITVTLPVPIDQAEPPAGPSKSPPAVTAAEYLPPAGSFPQGSQRLQPPPTVGNGSGCGNQSSKIRAHLPGSKQQNETGAAQRNAQQNEIQREEGDTLLGQNEIQPEEGDPLWGRSITKPISGDVGVHRIWGGVASPKGAHGRQRYHFIQHPSYQTFPTALEAARARREQGGTSEMAKPSMFPSLQQNKTSSPRGTKRPREEAAPRFTLGQEVVYTARDDGAKPASVTSVCPGDTGDACDIIYVIKFADGGGTHECGPNKLRAVAEAKRPLLGVVQFTCPDCQHETEILGDDYVACEMMHLDQCSVCIESLRAALSFKVDGP